MADMQIPVSGELLKPRCDIHCRDLLPLYCKSCDTPLCSDCVTLGQHNGHQLCEISKVVELHQRELQEVLSLDILTFGKTLNTEKTTPFLGKILIENEEKQKCLAVHTENLIRNIIKREEEIREMVRQWREKTVGKVMTYTNVRENFLRKEQSLIHALLHLKEKGFQLDSEEMKLEIMYLNCETRRLLTNKANLSDIGASYDFEKGSLNDDSNDMFGNISEVETSSDSISFSHNEKNEQKEFVEDEEEFHDCLELPRTYQAGKASIQGIIPIDSINVVLQSSNTVYLCNFEGEKFSMSTILECVHQIAHIPATGDILAIMEDQKQIRRITFNRNVITKFIYTDQTNDYFCCLTSGGKEAYACVVIYSTTSARYSNSSHINLLNDYGVILKKIQKSSYYYTRALYWEGYFLLISSGSFYQIERTDLIKQCPMGHFYKQYRGSVGSYPESRFCPTDLTIDSEDNVLVAVYNDNAIHLLDKSLTFQKLLMTEEDGLCHPTAVTIDTSGYLWVGCENEQIYRVNYQYLFSTSRQDRLKLMHVPVNEKKKYESTGLFSYFSRILQQLRWKFK
ncbi:uncharacterized protein LOC133178480 [Saccostrea echinata]|uniref:uncharacterized protein LOC133178480 n=1 Tax=Saccostrea echinata TaxID=191078 RepID=UPI002A80E039|nr:uncharacterized protein LOC133178480 [Saccostrea echinata]